MDSHPVKRSLSSPSIDLLVMRCVLKRTHLIAYRITSEKRLEYQDFR
jgi:hypothetical protein